MYSCHGAGWEVTGSCHLVQCGSRRVLIDCGLFQGGRELEVANYAPFGFDPASIDVVILTHAHLDHCGRLPRLVREGFCGPIITTAATRELVALVLADAAKLQAEDARHTTARSPLFTPYDVDRCLAKFDTPAAYNLPLRLCEGVVATFIDAGHILGSACVLLELDTGCRRRRIVFSGDVGSAARPILRDPTPAPDADYVVMETTYGDRVHRSLRESVKEFYGAIAETLDRGGNVVIPTFALERAQEVLYYLRQGVLEKALPQSMRVFLDSPMAVSATAIFRRHPECFDADFFKMLGQGDPFSPPKFHITREVDESMAINGMRSGAVILAGSGMCNGGRVVHHLRHNLAREKCSVIFVGYAAEGSLARRIIDGAKSVRIFGESLPVRAQCWTINGFSAHADQAGLLAWLGTAPRRGVFLVHGEYERGMSVMAACLTARGIGNRAPARHEMIALA
ncbi:MBL fold metallo-hydrolase [Dyella sp.]|uniref:MBL fold metallo-hydrolase n=1 Tax=Dyella sp. TaxID=1869338 RepID=UPI002ED27B82